MPRASGCKLAGEQEGCGELTKRWFGLRSKRGGRESFHLLQANAARLWIRGEHDDQLLSHHGGEEIKGNSAPAGGYQGEDSGDDGVHDPVREAAEALTFGADLVGEDLADVDPDDSALRKGEEGDEADQQPD